MRVYKGFFVAFAQSRKFFLFLLFMVCPLQGFSGISTFVPRSQSIDGARDLITWTNFASALSARDRSGLLVFIPKYTRSFGAKDITSYFMGRSQLNFSGSRVLGRGDNDILADYFGLPSDFQSTVGFNPHISTVQLDLSWYAQLASCEYGTWSHGGYLFVQAPLVHTRWDLQLQEKVFAPGVNFQPAGYMGKGTKHINRDQLAVDVKSAMRGKTTFGDMLDPLRFGKIDGAQSATGLSDVEISLGWFAQFKGGSLLGLAGYLTLPTGTRQGAEFLFAPAIGNGHHWEIGASFSSYLSLWKSCDERNECAISLFGRIGHLFGAHQKRSFDLVSGRGSRYMLLERMGPAIDDIVQIPIGQTLQTQYLGELLPAIHATTMDCRIGIDFQAEAAIALSVKHDLWRINVGYNFWMRSKEKLYSRTHLPSDTYGIKGDASLYGFEPLTRYYLGLNATQSRATLQGGQGTGNGIFQNLNADNPAPAALLTSLTVADAIALNIPNIGAAGGSNQPVFLSDVAIDEASALAPSAQSNKVFAEFSYNIEVNSVFLPYLGGGIDIEVVSKSDKVHAAAAQWGVWAYVGIAY